MTSARRATSSIKKKSRLERALDVSGIAVALGLGLALDLGLVDEERVSRIFDHLEPLARLGRLEETP